MNELGCVFDVDVDGAFAVGDGEFGFATKRERADDGAVGDIDGGSVIAAAVEGEDTLGARVVDDGIRIRAGLHGANGFQSLQIKNGGGVGATIAGEAAAKIGSDGDAVHALCIRNAADFGVSVRIKYNHLRGVRDIDAAGVGVHRNIIPAAFAADGDGAAARENDPAEKIVATESEPTSARRLKFLRMMFSLFGLVVFV